jgi:hypothetical protein
MSVPPGEIPHQHTTLNRCCQLLLREADAIWRYLLAPHGLALRASVYFVERAADSLKRRCRRKSLSIHGLGALEEFRLGTSTRCVKISAPFGGSLQK